MENDGMEQLKRDVSDIKRALLGDAKYDEVGLVRRVSSLEKWRGGLMLKLAGVTGACTVLLWILEKMILK